MLRNYLAGALRNLVRNRLYAAINVVGLAVGFAAALLIALFVRDEFSYDKWIPGHDRVYRIAMIADLGFKRDIHATTPPDVAAWLKLDYPQIEKVARLWPSDSTIRHDDQDRQEPIFWADPEFFAIFPLPAVSGTLRTALDAADGVVITREIARKYFGHDDVVGESLEIDHYPMRVTAVIQDLPSNTHLDLRIIAAGKASFSPLSLGDGLPYEGTPKAWSAYTYLALAPGASIDDLARDLSAFVTRHMPDRSDIGRNDIRFQPIRIDAIHLASGEDSTIRPPGDIAVIYAVSAIAGLIVLIAAFNFINLMTARATRRAVEVGVRKVGGATRCDLVVQFIGEALLYVYCGLLIATVLATLFLPQLNAFLQRTIAFPVWRSPALMMALVLCGLALGVLAGAYPALVLSRFNPASVLKGGDVRTSASERVRQSLVIMQFSVMIGLIVAAGVIYRQTSYASNEALRLDKDQVLLVENGCGRGDALKNAIAALPGVHAAACSFQMPGESTLPMDIFDSKGQPHLIYYNPVDFGFFELYGLQPLAGRFFSREFGADMPPVDRSAKAWQEPVVINETTAHNLGYASAQDAVGQIVRWMHIQSVDSTNSVARFTPVHAAEIVGVAPDFPMGTVRTPIAPAVFYVDPTFFTRLNVKLVGKNMPETLKAIDAIWKETGEAGPPQRLFFDAYVQSLYRDIESEQQLLSILTGIAMLIACLGLFGLAAAMADRRTKEIGIRKAMGASKRDILGLLFWQFTKPVLWANVIAWPVAYFIMHRWLEGFAYHIDLAPWMFLAASALALVIAVLTVIGHALLVARAKPVAALRYE